MGEIAFRRYAILQSFTWRGLGWFLLFAFAMSVWSWSGVLLLTNKTLDYTEQLEYFGSLLQRNVLNYFPMYVAAMVVDGLPLAGRRKIVTILVAVLVGALLSVQLRCAISKDQLFYVYTATQLPYCTAFPTWRTYFDFPAGFLTPLTMGALVTVFILSRRRNKELAAALESVRGAQIEARRSRIEAEMTAMRSRVDPGKLVESLRSIRELYEKRLEDGEAKLDALIGDLRRAARPQGS